MTPERGLAAAIVVVLYVLLCAATLRGRSKRARASVIESATANGAPAMLVAYASQTGYAEYLARQTAHA
ncbi:MAG: oxidoreductase, partial [Proteobacteria bacterium]